MGCSRFVFAAAAAVLGCAAFADDARSALDPLDMRWTFGAHEPYTMYRRVGARCTGGVQGGALWLRDWFKWWDSEDCPRLMEELGLNWVLCRFYKGMGWEEEKKDFPNVKRFVGNCHRHGVRAVAYIQYSTFYPESMGREVPDLMDWAARDSNGRPYHYCGMYFRYEPCPNNPAFEEYLKKMVRIALEEGGFDGVFFDNAYVQACYCRRCEKLFREHLRTIPSPQERFGYDDLSGFGLPEYANKGDFHWSVPWGEVREPLLQEFNDWRSKRFTRQFARLREYAHSLKPDCVFAANICPYRAPYTVGNKSVDMTELPKCFDLVMGQVEPSPRIVGDAVVNRVRDLKYAREFPRTTYFASCDGAAGDSVCEDESRYLLPLIEDAVFGGVPADRTIMAPCPERPRMVNTARLARRRPQLAAFNRFVSARRASLAAPNWMPVRLLVSAPAMALSERSYMGLLAAEEVALRSHLPFGYSISTPADPLPHADEAQAVVVADQTCLSDAQVDALAAYAKKGGRLVVTGESGRYDEWNRQRFDNPLKSAVAGLPNVTWREKADKVEPMELTHIKYIVRPPEGGCDALARDLASVGCGAYPVVSAPQTVLAEFKAEGGRRYVHLLNYEFTKPVSVVLRLPEGTRPEFSAPFDETPSAESPREVSPGVWMLPAFTRYACCTVSI